MSAAPEAAVAGRQPPSVSELFVGFLQIGLSGFGGVLPWARRKIVEQRRWLSGEEFTELLGLGQFLPGPNILNVSVCIGRRFHGARGALAAVGGLMAAPLAIVILLGLLFARYGGAEPVRAAFAGVASAAAGLVAATALKMARPMRGDFAMLAVLAATFLAFGVLRLPLLWVLAGLVPLSVAVAWRRLP